MTEKTYVVTYGNTIQYATETEAKKLYKEMKTAYKNATIKKASWN